MNLSIRNLSKSFEGELVLDNLSLDVENVHAMAIIGSSGGGKTTLLRIIAGLEKPDSGSVFVNGKEIIFEESFLNEYRKTVGMVFQSFNLFPHLSANDNIVVPLTVVHKLDKKTASAKSRQLLEKFELLEHKNKIPSQLSGGQRQRVAIARALSIDPEFLLLDEPTSALDPSLTKSVIRTIETLRKENKDLILVTHEMAFAKEACDYFVFIKDGVIADYGDKQTFFSQKASKLLDEFLNA
ncbi:MAG: amino acid ABC transporter ATP-binding protein [Erysipelothrix sp.]|nr:amino acid ABC transporter ATP-binding protein [Erysipelothrix sp.]